MFSPDCCRGVPGDENYKPKGSFVVKHNLNVYEVKARSGKNKGTLLFLPDAFGLASHNVILSDLYATEGYDVLLVDILEGDPLPIAFMKYVPGTDIGKYDNFTAKDKNIVRKVDMTTWGVVHNPAHIWSLVVSLVEKLKQEMPSETKLYALGHCFGGKHALKLAQETAITAVITMHPSFLEPSDSRNLNCPVFVGCAETDFLTPTLIQDMLLALPESTHPYKFVVYGHTKHGFSSRADMGDEKARKVLMNSFDDSVRWIGDF